MQRDSLIAFVAVIATVLAGSVLAAETIVADVHRGHVHFLGEKGYVVFSGYLKLTNGNMAADFRDASALGSLRVEFSESIPGGGSSPGGERSRWMVVYEKPSIPYTVRDHNPNGNRERWVFRDGPREAFRIMWNDPLKYDARFDPDLPADVGGLHTRFIHAEETLFQFDRSRARLPITVKVNDTHLLTVDASGRASSDPDHRIWVRGKRVYILVPFRVREGAVTEWYRDADPTDGYDNHLHTHEATDDNTKASTFYNAGGRFLLEVPFAAEMDVFEPIAAVTIAFGGEDIGILGEASFIIDDWTVRGRHWLYREDDDD